MRPWDLARSLLRIGARSRREQAGLIRAVAVLVSSCALTAAALALGTVHLTYAAQHTRAQARAPIELSEQDSSAATGRWALSSDLVAGRLVSVIQIEPLTADAPLPPGLDAWPAPGSAVLSPALLEAGADEGIAERYGTPVGRIARAGLVSDSEQLAYVRPRQGVRSGVLIDGFGVPMNGPGAIGDPPYQQGEPAFLMMVGFLLLAPALVLHVVAARTGSTARDRRVRLLGILGGTFRHRLLLSAGEAAAPLLTGSGITLALLVTLLHLDIRIPLTGFPLRAADLRAEQTTLLLIWLLSTVVALLTIVLMNEVLPPSPGRRRIPGGLPVRTAVVCPVMLFVAVAGANLATPGSLARMAVNYTGTLGVLITLPAVAAILSAAAGEGLARLGRRRAAASMVISGRWLQDRPRITARVVAGVVVAIGLVVQAQVWYGIVGQQVRNAEQVRTGVGAALAVVAKNDSVSTEQLRSFISALPGQVSPVVVSHTGRSILLTGDCAGLTALTLPCADSGTDRTTAVEDPRLNAYLSWSSGPADTVRVRSVDDPAAIASSVPSVGDLLVLTSDNSVLPRIDLERIAWSHLSRGAMIQSPGGGWIAVSTMHLTQGRWILLLAPAAVALLIVACGIAGVAEFMVWSRRMLTVSVLSGNRRVLAAAAGWIVALPIALAGALGIGLGSWLAVPTIRVGDSHLSAGLLLTCAGVSALLAVALWAWATVAAVRAARSWEPLHD